MTPTLFTCQAATPRKMTVARHHIQRRDVISDLATRGRPFRDVVCENVRNSSLHVEQGSLFQGHHFLVCLLLDHRGQSDPFRTQLPNNVQIITFCVSNYLHRGCTSSSVSFGQSKSKSKMIEGVPFRLTTQCLPDLFRCLRHLAMLQRPKRVCLSSPRPNWFIVSSSETKCCQKGFCQLCSCSQMFAEGIAQ